MMIQSMLERDGKHEGGLVLAPIDREELKKLSFMNRAILRKHEQTNLDTNQRRDLRLPAKLDEEINHLKKNAGIIPK